MPEFRVAGEALIVNSFVVTELPDFPPNSNPFHHDLYHMGSRLGTNLIAMFPNHDSEKSKYLILVNTETGKRIKITM